MRPSLTTSAERVSSSRRAPPPEGRGDDARRIGDIWQWLGTSGDPLGTNGVARRTLLYCYAIGIVVVGAVSAINVITTHHEEPQFGLAAPIIWEGTSWLTFTFFLWIGWIAYRIAPLWGRPRWRLLVHIPAAVAFSLAHVAGFVALRKLVYWLGGGHYEFGAFLPHFSYELAKDALGYALFIAAFALIEHLLRQQSLIDAPGQTLTFDIRDGSRLTRVRLDQVLAIASAGNYVEFVLDDGRKLLMRSPLSALESELAPRGFLRTHRSWLVNAGQMTALKPEGSGDYTVELGSVTAPLSRRFPAALAKLRGG
jgi:DNA-binding LytR/AlgR family response regulator